MPARIKNKNDLSSKKSEAFTKPESKEDLFEKVALNFRITSIMNLSEYGRSVKIYDFEIEPTHHHFEVKSSNERNGEIYVCPCPDSAEEIDINKINVLPSTSVERVEFGLSLDYSSYLEIDPTDIDDINKLIDAPLLISLYQIEEREASVLEPRITFESVRSQVADGGKRKSTRKEAENQNKTDKKKQASKTETLLENTESFQLKTPIGYAYIDLMNYVQDIPASKTEKIYIYPIVVHAELKTPIVTMEIHSDKPLRNIENKTVCNSVTITLENIFNPPAFILSPTIEVFVDLSLITGKIEEGDFEKKKIVTFSHGKVSNYMPNDLFKRWNHLAHMNCIGLLTPIEVDDNLIGVYNYKNINLSVIDEHYVVYRFNSICRQLILSDCCTELESLINDSEEQIMVEIRFQDTQQKSEEILKDMQALYVGTIDVAPLLYPEVKTGRFIIPIQKFDRSVAPVASKAEKKVKPKRVVPLDTKKLGRSLSVITRDSPSMETLPTKPTGVLRQKKEVKEEEEIDDAEVELGETKYCATSMIERPLGEEMFLILELAFETQITNVPSTVVMIKPMASQPTEPDISSDEELELKVAAEAIEMEFEQQIVQIFQQLPRHIEMGASVLNKCQLNLADKIENVPFLKEMRANMVNTIMRLVAVKYNHKRKTNDNEHFKNLMSNVYNDLTDTIVETANNYFSGTDNALVLNEKARKDLHVFIAKEFRESNHKAISDFIYKQKLNDPGNYEEALIDLAICDLENLQFELALSKAKELLLRNPKHLYALIIQAYVEYVSNGISAVYPHLVNITRQCPCSVEIWTLLYVLYKMNNYRAGYKHSKMQYEKNCAGNLKWLPFFASRKEPYFDVEFDKCATHNCMYIFLKLGTYKFAEILFEIQKDHLKEKERLKIISCIHLLTGQYEKGLENLKNFKKTATNELLLRLYKGHFLYAMGKEYDAILEYQVVFHSPQSRAFSQIAALRCGFWDLKQGSYETAKTYFSACARNMGTFLSWYGLGVSFYRTNKFEEAELSFSKATDLYKPFLEIWIYLAMVNLKLNRKNEAIICFETARKYHMKNSDVWNEMIACFREMNVPLPPLF